MDIPSNSGLRRITRVRALLTLLGAIAVAVVALHGDAQANEQPATPQITTVVPHELNPEHWLLVEWLPVDKPDGATRFYYSVRSSTDEKFWVQSAVGITTTSHYERSLPKNAARYYQVRSVAAYTRSDGTPYAVASGWSSSVQGRVFVFDAPGQPVVKADPENPSSAMRLEIDGTTFPTTPTLDRGFAIEYRAPGGTWQPADNGEWVGNNDEGVPNVYIHQGLRPSTAYEYRVQAWYRVDNPAVDPRVNPNYVWFSSGWSPSVSDTTGRAPAPTPSAAPASSNEWHSIAVEWDSALLPRGAENMTYSLAVSNTPDNDWQGLGGPNWTELATGLTRPTYTHSGLEPGVVRYYRVQAVYRDSDGQRQTSGWGAVGSGATWAIPKPVDLGLSKNESSPHTRAVADWLDTGVPAGTTYAGWSYRLTRDDWAVSWGYIGYGLHETVAEPPLSESDYVAHHLLYLEPGQDYTFELWTRVYIEETGQWYEGEKVSVDFSQPALNVPTGVAIAPGTADPLRSLTVTWDHDLRFETLRANGHDAYDIEVSDTAADGSWTMLVQDARGTSYTHTGLPPGAHRHYRVRHVLHQDGEWHSGWSAPGSDRTETESNSPAEGAPVISGTAQVGETLTADTSGISDADGLDNATFTYQWLADGTDISGATGFSYTPVAGDVGKAVSVRVSFTDDAGNAEALTSTATAAVVPADSPADESVVPAPTDLTVERGSDPRTMLVLDWAAIPTPENATGVTYEIEWAYGDFINPEIIPDNPDWQALATGVTGTTYTHTGISFSNTIVYQVRAVVTSDGDNGVPQSENGPWSDPAVGTTETHPIFSKPTFTVSPAGGDPRHALTIRWDQYVVDPAVDPVMDIDVRSTAPTEDDYSWERLATVTDDATFEYTHTGLAAGETRFYRIILSGNVKSDGRIVNGVLSDVVSAATEAAPAVDFVIYHDPEAGDAAVNRYNQGVKALKDADISYSEVTGDVQDDVDRLAGVSGSVLPRFFLGDPTADGWTSQTKVNNGGLRWLKEKVAELSED